MQSIDIDLENQRVGFRGKWLPISIRRSERVTFGLTVKPDQEVIVRVPVTAEDESINRFLERKKNWINRLRINEGAHWKITPGRYFIVIETPRPDRTDLIREHFQTWL